MVLCLEQAIGSEVRMYRVESRKQAGVGRGEGVGAGRCKQGRS
jgi:hypothetical protein